MGFISAPTAEPEVCSTEILTPAEAARFMRCGHSTIRRWTSQGRIPVHTIAGRPRYIKTELLALLDSRVTN